MRSAAAGEHRTGEDRGRSLYPGALARRAMRRQETDCRAVRQGQSWSTPAACAGELARAQRVSDPPPRRGALDRPAQAGWLELGGAELFPRDKASAEGRR